MKWTQRQRHRPRRVALRHAANNAIFLSNRDSSPTFLTRQALPGRHPFPAASSSRVAIASSGSGHNPAAISCHRSANAFQCRSSTSPSCSSTAPRVPLTVDTSHLQSVPPPLPSAVELSPLRPQLRPSSSCHSNPSYHSRCGAPVIGVRSACPVFTASAGLGHGCRHSGDRDHHIPALTA